MSRLDKFSNYLSVLIFVQRAYHELDSIDDHDFFLRSGDGTKKLIEEILPLTVFLKHFERPGRYLRCRYFQKDQNYDAKIKVFGDDVDKRFISDTFFVEVTLAEAENTEHLKREALLRYGLVFGGNNIKRVKNARKGINEIKSKPVVQESNYAVNNAIELVKKALERKNRKKYPVPCILVIQVAPERTLNSREWLILITEIQSYVNREKFWATYVVNWSTSSAFKV